MNYAAAEHTVTIHNGVNIWTSWIYRRWVLKIYALQTHSSRSGRKEDNRHPLCKTRSSRFEIEAGRGIIFLIPGKRENNKKKGNFRVVSWFTSRVNHHKAVGTWAGFARWLKKQTVQRIVVSEVAMKIMWTPYGVNNDENYDLSVWWELWETLW